MNIKRNTLKKQRYIIKFHIKRFFVPEEYNVLAYSGSDAISKTYLYCLKKYSIYYSEVEILSILNTD